VREYARPIFRDEVDRFKLDAYDICHRRGVDEIFPGRAVLVGVVVFPVLHEQADDLESLLFHEPGRDR
jgi:hypothetical protein